MDIKETGKKLKPFAPVLSVALVTACVAGSLSGYEAPVYAATQEETPVKKEETKEKKEEKSYSRIRQNVIELTNLNNHKRRILSCLKSFSNLRRMVRM